MVFLLFSLKVILRLLRHNSCFLFLEKEKSISEKKKKRFSPSTSLMEQYTQFLNMVAEEEEWSGSHKVSDSSEDKKLELRLGPPGEFPCYRTLTATPGSERVLQGRVNEKQGQKFSSCYEEESEDQGFSSPRLSCPSDSPTFTREAQLQEVKQHPYLHCSKVARLQSPDKKVRSGASNATFSAATAAGSNASHKRVAPVPVVGWPPIRSFRKNLTTSVSSSNPKEGRSRKPESSIDDRFVKINMEGVPIGRKINLNAYDSYDKLSVAIDELFRGLLAAQREIRSASRNEKGKDEAKERAEEAAPEAARSGEYTLVYEDNEGDRILVGDVPWHMFVSTAKRLRVLKSSELSTP